MRMTFIGPCSINDHKYNELIMAMCVFVAESFSHEFSSDTTMNKKKWQSNWYHSNKRDETGHLQLKFRWYLKIDIKYSKRILHTHTRINFCAFQFVVNQKKMNKMKNRYRGGRSKKKKDRNTGKTFSRKLSCFKCLCCEIWSHSKVMDRLLQKYTHFNRFVASLWPCQCDASAFFLS